jgi:hypothetical protein
MRLTCLLLFLVACPGSDKETGGSDTSVTDTAPVDHATGNVNGTVSVQLYTDGGEDLVDLSWDEYGGEFPFGAIFVAAYTVDETTNAVTYYDEFVISSPSTTGDAYTLDIDLDDTESVYVYAALDWWPDGVIGTSEPIGTWADPIALIEGDAVNDVDIVISAPLLPTGGGGGTYLTLSGDVAITQTYTGGDARVMVYDSAGQGPGYVATVTPTATSDGATASFSMPILVDSGDVRLLGAWDNDQNGLIEPTDLWGAYVVEGENANPLTAGSTDLGGYTVEIPFGIAPALTPFVRLEGQLEYDDFATLPAGTVVYVTALRTRPTGDFSVTDLERGYDWMSFTGVELVGTGLDYTLVAPASAVAYLWAYADLDGDGVLNESGEPVASYGRTGRISVGSANQSGLDMPLQTVTE